MSKLQKIPVPFAQVANNPLQSPELSLRAKGLYAYLRSKPEGWHFSAKRIADEMKDGRQSVLTTLNELETSGYLRRVRRGDGRMDYEIGHTPHESKKKEEKPGSGDRTRDSQKPGSGKRTVRQAHGGGARLVSNTESNKQRDKQTKSTDAAEAATAGIPGSVINDLIDQFKHVNPTHDLLFRRKPQREAMERLVKRFGEEKVRSILATLPKTNEAKYAPTITTPHQLEEDLGKLISYVRKEQESGKTKNVIL